MEKNNILILAAHPDDETLGCGGTILKYASEGYKIFCLAMTNGINSREYKKKDSYIIERKKNFIKASKILNFKPLLDESFQFEDNQMDSYPLLKIIKVIEKVKKKIQPKIIFTHHPFDLNVDHCIVTKAALTAFRPQNDEKWTNIFTYEVPSSTDYNYQTNEERFNPNTYFAIDKFWKKKEKALNIYNSELKKYPHSRSLKKIKNLNEFRGGESGLKLAESFCLLKEIKR